MGDKGLSEPADGNSGNTGRRTCCCKPPDRRAGGQPFFSGRRATGFTNAEEFLARLKDVVPFLLEDEMKASGADFHSALLPLLSHVEQDGDLITGQNPHSSEAVAKALVEALAGR